MNYYSWVGSYTGFFTVRYLLYLELCARCQTGNCLEKKDDQVLLMFCYEVSMCNGAGTYLYVRNVNNLIYFSQILTKNKFYIHAVQILYEIQRNFRELRIARWKQQIRPLNKLWAIHWSLYGIHLNVIIMEYRMKWSMKLKQSVNTYFHPLMCLWGVIKQVWLWLLSRFSFHCVKAVVCKIYGGLYPLLL